MQRREIVIKVLLILLSGTMAAAASAGALEIDMTVSEDSLLSEYSATFFRPDQDNLCFVNASGDTLCFSDSISMGDESLWASHELCGYLPDENFFTVRILGFEYSLFLLVNVHSGWSTFALSPPVQSPDGERLLCACNSPIGYSFYEIGIQIFRIEADSLVMEFSGTNCDWYPERVRWLSDNEVAYSRLPLFPSDPALEGGTICLDSAGNWIPNQPDHWSSANRDGVEVFQWVEDLYLNHP